MLKNIIFIIIGTSLIFLSACKMGVKPENLRGKWKYVKVFKPEASPPDSVSTMELEEMKPYIEFTGDDKLQIIWGGEVLSKGTYKINGDNLNFTEVFADGTKRSFPFYVSKITDKEIIFETVGEDGSRVTAVKDK
jgi:hypothetical protein